MADYVRMFDPHFEISSLLPVDLENLLDFSVTGGLCVPAFSREPRNTEELRRWLEEHEAQVGVVRRFGFDARLVFGVAAELLPQTSVEPVLEWLEARAIVGALSAIGELSFPDDTPWNLRLLDAQLQLAQRYRLPVLLRWPDPASPRQIETLLGALERAALPASRVWFTGIGEAQLYVLDSSRWGCLLHAGPFGLPPERCAELLALPEHADRLLVGTGPLSGGTQPFALPAVQVACDRLGVPVPDARVLMGL